MHLGVNNKVSFDDYLAGRDPVLEVIYDYAS
jgi:hypothetical protein